MNSPEASAVTVRLYVWLTLVWKLCTTSYWMLLFVRVTLEVGLDPLQIVLLGTAKEITILTMEIPTGAVADLVSRRLSVIIGFATCGAAIIAAGLADTFWLLVLTQVAWAFGSTFRSGADTAWLSDELGGGTIVDNAILRAAQYQSVGTVIGVVAASAFAALWSVSAAMVGLGLILVTTSMVLVVRMHETAFVRVSEARRARFFDIIKVAATTARRVVDLRILVIATVLSGFASEAVDRLYVARLDAIGFPRGLNEAFAVGMIVAAQAVGTTLLLSRVGKRLTGPVLPPALAALQVGVAVGVASLAGVSVFPVAVAGLIFAGMLRTVTGAITIAWANHFTTSETRATVLSFVGQAHSLGEITGGITLGFIASQAGVHYALGVSAVVYLVSAVVARRATFEQSEVSTA